MNINEQIQANGQTLIAWHSVGRVAVVIVLAAIFILAVWIPTSAGVTQNESSSQNFNFDSASQAGSREQTDRAKDGEQLAKNYGEWLTTAHHKAGVTAEVKPLPSQF